MTVAAGFVCSDGIVLAADSEYTYNYSKYEGEKLFQFGTDHWAIGIAIAGTMPLAKMFISDLNRELRKILDLQGLHEKIIERAVYFKERYIRLETEEIRQLLLLIAIQMKSSDENLLLSVNGDVVDPVERSHFIGVGDELARATSSWLFDPSMPRHIVSQLAMHVINWTSEHTKNCGQSLYAMVVPKPWKVQRVFIFGVKGEFFWGLNELLRPILMGCMDVLITDKDFDASLKKLEEKMRAVRACAFQAVAPPPGLPPGAPNPFSST